MLHRLPPRVQMFLEGMSYAVLGVLAAKGAIALEDGHARPPSLAMVIGLFLGCIAAALFRPVPPRITDHRARVEAEREKQ